MHGSSRAAKIVTALGLATLAAACSFITDFDRGKIHTSETGGKSGTGGHPSGGEPVDSGMGGAPESGGGGNVGNGGTGGDAGGDAPKPACDTKTHVGCAADELCCDTTGGPACKKTSLDECTSCGVACPEGLATTCVARACECEKGTNRPCSGTGAESICYAPPSGEPNCVECHDSTDCTGNDSECVGDRCVACDPSNNAGCKGDQPICDSTTHTCKACSMSPNDCGGTLKCTTSGACGGCANSVTDCTTPTAPICDADTTCRGCKDDAECVAERGTAFCVDKERCAICNPTTEDGCTDPAKPDCRFDSNSEISCQACTADNQCQGRSATPVCNTTNGHCVECTSDNDCTGNAKKPLCLGHACVACDDGGVTGDADARCAAKPGGKAACVRSGTQKGECGACNPGDSKPCPSDKLCCETSGIAACAATSASQCSACGVPCNPMLANSCTDRGCRCGSGPACPGTGTEKLCAGSGTCVECDDDTDCTNAAAPLCEGNSCVACERAANANTRCTAKGAGACASSGPRQGHCSDCEPGSDFGCSSGSVDNRCDPATATCVDCVGNAGCDTASTKPICASTACRACASDAECAALGGAVGPLCGATGACGADAACSADTECTDGLHGECVDVGSGVLRCRVCDPSDNAGCPNSAPACSAEFVCGP